MIDTAKALPIGWQSRVLANLPPSRVRLLRVDPAGLPSEALLKYSEALTVPEGQLKLRLGEDVLPLCRGDFALIPDWVPHEILPSGRAAILLIDPQ